MSGGASAIGEPAQDFERTAGHERKRANRHLDASEPTRIGIAVFTPYRLTAARSFIERGI